jgi:hypothetical protein
MQEDDHIAITETSYINDQLAYQWVQLFHKWTIGRTIRAKRLVLCDRFGAHMTRQFVQFCEKNNIILFFLLPHTSHVLQPLDVGVFSVYKHWHSEAVEAATMTGCRKFTKDEFLYSIGEIRAKTFRPRTIKLGFKLTGLWPINSELITEDLTSYNPYDDIAPRSDTPSTTSQFTEFSTPKTADKVRRISDHIKQYDPSSERFQMALDKLVKGAEAQATLAYELRREFDRTEAIMATRHARYNISRRTMRITGIISSDSVKEMKLKEYKRSEKADQEKWKRKFKKVLVEIRKLGRAKKRRQR